MKKKEDIIGNLPFSDLRSLFKNVDKSKGSHLEAKKAANKAGELVEKNSESPKKFEKIIEQPKIVDDSHLFTKAMSDVVPFEDQNYIPKVVKKVEKVISKPKNDDEMVLDNLDKLVTSGIGFAVFDTPEYMEGTGYDINPLTTKRLHRGDFSIQDHIDLHGHSVAEAQISFDNFLRESISSGKRAVLIIHGRGLSSPGEPVLKKKVSDWLTSGQWRKWIVSYTSARPEDGGAGATYVLLRTKPVSKSARKGNKINCY